LSGEVEKRRPVESLSERAKNNNKRQKKHICTRKEKSDRQTRNELSRHASYDNRREGRGWSPTTKAD